jgi:hypothetical protein
MDKKKHPYLLAKPFSMTRLFLFLAFACSIVSCRFKSGSGNIVSENRQVAAFTGIKTGNGFEVTVKIGSPAGVVIQADDNLMRFVQTEVKNDVLRIGLKSNTQVADATLKAIVTVPSLNRILASSGAEVTVENELKGDRKIVLEASSGASISLMADAPEVNAEASSSGKVVAKGRTRDFLVTTSSGGVVEAFELMAEQTEVTASSGSEASVFASVKMVANASSGADIRYRGEAKLTANSSSGGSVNKD